MVHRSFAIAVVAAAACRGGSPHEREATPHVTPTPLVTLDAHRNATELFGGNELLMSFTRDWDNPGPLRLSKGTGRVERTFQGWPIGVAGDRAYVLEPVGSDLRVLRTALAGEPDELARIPMAPAPYRSQGAVTGDGHVAIATPIPDKGATLRIIGPDKTVRLLDLVRDTDAVEALVANPRGSEIALVTTYMHGRLAPGTPEAAITVVDAAAGTTRWSVTLPEHLWATEGEAGFIDGKLAVHLRGGLYGYELATGARTELIARGGIDARTMTFAPTGDALAYVHWVHPGDMVPLSMRRACEVHVVRANGAANGAASGAANEAANEAAPAAPAIAFETGCYFGTGILFVGRTLWVAPLGP